MRAMEEVTSSLLGLLKLYALYNRKRISSTSNYICKYLMLDVFGFKYYST